MKASFVPQPPAKRPAKWSPTTAGLSPSTSPTPVVPHSPTTLEGTMRASLDDWIIRGVKGEFYPCKPDVFKDTYEPADATPTEGAEK